MWTDDFKDFGILFLGVFLTRRGESFESVVEVLFFFESNVACSAPERLRVFLDSFCLKDSHLFFEIGY